MNTMIKNINNTLTATLILAASVFQTIGGCTWSPEPTLAAPASPQVEDADGPLSVSDSKELIEDAAETPEAAQVLEDIVKLENGNTNHPLVAGNRVELLVDGPKAFAAIFDDIAKAEDHIHLETYILADDEIGQRLAELITERRAAGVEVAIIYDDLGSLTTSDEYFERLRNAGVRLFKFHPVNPVDDIRVWRINQRNHRKVLIVDGRVAFTGGMNITEVYRSSSSSPASEEQQTDDRWRDTQIRIEGPVVAEFQKLFLQIWKENTEGEPLNGQHYFPELEERGESLVRVVPHLNSDDDKADQYDIYAAYSGAIALARKRIWITQAYFVPDEKMLDALQQAARRGVDVRIILPGFTDSTLVLHASRNLYDDLLEAGVNLYERQDALLHAKTAVMDGVWSTVGSSNFDYRSFLHNDEANAVIVGRDFGRQMEKLFQVDLEHAHQIRLDEWRKRPIWMRLMETFSSVFSYWI